MCSPQTLDIISRKVYLAARDVLGDKLEKVLLFGSYARGDYDDESDIDYFVLADIPRIKANEVRERIHDLAGDFLWDYDQLVCLHVTSSSIFHRFLNVTPYYMNVMKDGKELSYV